MIRPTGKIKIDTIVTEKAIHIRFVPTIKRKRTTTTTSPSPVNKVKPVLITFQRYKNAKQTVTTLQSKKVELKEEESDLSDSDGESNTDSFLY